MKEIYQTPRGTKQNPQSICNNKQTKFQNIESQARKKNVN